MFSTQFSTIVCLVLQISMSARPGHAVDIQRTSWDTEVPAPLSAAYISAVESPTTVSHKERRTHSARSNHPVLKRRKAGLAGHSSHKRADGPQAPGAGNNQPDSMRAKKSTSTASASAASTASASAASIASASSASSASGSSTASTTNSTTSSTSGTNTGEATYYATGLGACGITSTDSSMIAAASHLLFDSFPGATANTNNNPICGRKVKATYQGNSVEVELVDRCTGCAMYDLDFSPSAFAKLGSMDAGRLSGMTWTWA